MSLEEKASNCDRICTTNVTIMCSPNGFSPANPGALTSLGIRGTGPNDKLSCYTVSRSSARDEDTPLAERSPGVALARLNTFDGWTSEVAWENGYAMRSPPFPSDHPHSSVSIHLQSVNQTVLSERIPQHPIPGAPLRVCTLQVRPCVYNPD